MGKDISEEFLNINMIFIKNKILRYIIFIIIIFFKLFNDNITKDILILSLVIGFKDANDYIHHQGRIIIIFWFFLNLKRLKRIL